MPAQRSIKAFIEAIIEVERTFDMSISHQDCHGAFIVEDYSDENADWLRQADNETTAGGQNAPQ